MTMHELATNAGKYGALSNSGGRVEIEWSLRRAGQGDAFTISWREHGGPLVAAPARRGFGSTVISRTAPRKASTPKSNSNLSPEVCPGGSNARRKKSPAAIAPLPPPLASAPDGRRISNQRWRSLWRPAHRLQAGSAAPISHPSRPAVLHGADRTARPEERDNL